MAETIRLVDYFYTEVPDKAGEAARILGLLRDAGVYLLVFSGFPKGRRAQLDFVAPDTAAFKAAAKKAKLKLVGPKKAFVIYGDDRIGVGAELLEKLAQAKINEVEAASQSGFQAGWRPLAGYVCVAGLAYEFLVRPLLPWVLTVAGGADVPPLPSLDDVLFELIFGMLGLGTLRSADRWNRMSAITPKSK